MSEAAQAQFLDNPYLRNMLNSQHKTTRKGLKPMKSRDESQQEFTVESVGQLSRAGYELVTVKKASEILGYSPRHVRRLANSGQLIAIKISRLWLVVPQLIKSCPPAGVHDTS